MLIADERVRQAIYGSQDFVRGRRSMFVVTSDEEVRSVFVVTSASDADFTVTCSCVDFQRNAEKDMTVDDLEKRKQASKKLRVEDEWSQYGARMFKVVTPDKNGGHENLVTLVKGGGEIWWLCKHILAVLLSGSVTPEVVMCDVVLESDHGVRANGGVVVGWGGC